MVKRFAGYLVAAGLTGYALFAPISITVADIVLLVAMAGAVPLWMVRQPAPYVRPVAIALGAYLAVKLLTAILALDPARGFAEYLQLWPLLLFLVIPLTAHAGPQRQVLLRVLAVSVSAVCLYALWQHFFGVEYWSGKILVAEGDRFPPHGFFSHQLTLAGFTLVTALFFGGLAIATKQSRVLYGAAGLLSFFVLLATYTRGSLIGVVPGVAIIVTAGRAGRRAGLTALLVGVVLLALSPGFQSRLDKVFTRALHPQSDYSRLVIWRTAWEIGASRPLCGIGPGGFEAAYEKFKLRADMPAFSHAHNQWLQEWATSGLPGVLASSLLWAAVGWALWRRRRGSFGIARAALAAWVGIAFASLTQCHFSDEEVLMVTVFIVALGLLPESAEAEDRYKE